MTKVRNNEPAQLIIPRDKARQSIDLQIEKGRTIRDGNINSEIEFEKAKEAHSKWSSYNSELLKQIFSNGSIAQEYNMVGFSSIGVFGYDAPDIQKDVKDFKIKVGKKIRVLESVNERLDIIPGTGVADSDIRYEDVLLPILNRRYIDEVFPSIIKDSIFRRQPVSLIMIDIDNFGSFNKIYSVIVGDDVLKITGKLIKDVVGEKGKVAKYGGEEIGIILPNYDIEESTSLAERIRRTIGHYNFDIKGKVVKLTISAGVSCCSSSIELKDFIEQADNAVRISKNKGRNQVNVFGHAVLKDPVTDTLGFADILGYGAAGVKEVSNTKIVDKLHLSRKFKGMYSLGELYNLSGEDILNLEILYTQLDTSGTKLVMARVINTMEDPLRARPSYPTIIKTKEILHIIDFPRTTVDVTVTGKIASSGELYRQEFHILPVELKS